MHRKNTWLFFLSLISLMGCSIQTNDLPSVKETDEAETKTADVTATANTAEESDTANMELKTWLAEVNARHISVRKPDDEQLASLTTGRTPDVSKINYCTRNVPLLIKISAEDALSDTEKLFDLLKDCYGGYTYFGGDTAFNQAKQAITDKLNACENISVSEWAALLRENLFAFITDYHFFINNANKPHVANFYYSKDSGFIKEAQVFINRDTGRRLTAVYGYDINDIFRLHIDSTGAFVWNPVVLWQGNPKTVELTLKYEDNSEQALALYPYGQAQRAKTASLDRSSGFPVVRVPQMEFDAAAGGESARQFLRYAEELRDEKVVIVDLRGNPGGNGILPKKWMHSLTGRIVPHNYVILQAMPFQPVIEMDEEKDSPYYITHEDRMLYYQPIDYANGYTLYEHETDAFIEREPLLIVLVDRGTASAAEAFTDLCFNIQNTLIIGSATGGVLNFDLTYPSLILPRSGLSFGFGTSLYKHPEGHLAEGIGILPDAWVAGDALEAAVAMLKKAGY